jgi:hypothetical protein
MTLEKMNPTKIHMRKFIGTALERKEGVSAAR